MPRSYLLVAAGSLTLFACGGGDDQPAATAVSSSASSGGATSSSSPSTSASSSSTGGGMSVDEIMGSLPASCAFTCDGTCAEPATPYACPTLAAWDALPHDPSCAAFDGTYPKPQQGKCTATAPSGDSVRHAGVIGGSTDAFVLPDGHAITPAGAEWQFQESDLEGTFPMSLLAIPGTSFVVNSDGGIDDNALRVIDTTLIGTSNPVVSYVPFYRKPDDTSLYYGIAFVAPNRIYASGGGDGKVYAFTVDVSTGALARDSASDIPLPASSKGPYYSSGIATTGDGSRLVVAPNEGDPTVLVLSLATATYGQLLGTIAISSNTVFDLQRDPSDMTGNTFVATDEGKNQVDLLDAAAITLVHKINVDKNPAQIAFLDARYFAVAESDGDEIAVIDRVSSSVAVQVPAYEVNAPLGFSPSALAYDATAHRLYTALAAVNAVGAYDVDLSGSTPVLAPSGRLTTSWWPTALVVDASGNLVVTNGKGHGEGTDDMQYPWAQGPITERMRGTVQRIPAPQAADLTAGSAAVDANFKLSDLPDRSSVTCPNGADDFPVPATNTAGPSKLIKHVILVIRENKTYDGVMGDRSDLGDGDPSLIMASTTKLEAGIWQNTRKVASAFTNFDNFYTDAEQSLQGHNWTVFGRTTDYMERSWLTIWGRGTRSEGDAVGEAVKPEEGGVFDWLAANNVPVKDFGEIVGGGMLDLNYPGLVFAQDLPDTQKSCYLAGHIRLLCDLPSFSYVVEPCDHTDGGSAGSAAPEVMIAVNDEATGMLADALSHSPNWQDTLLIVTEDDPQDGGDHIDLHRSLLFMASPWVKRGYVSHGHYDMASVYKLVSHVLGIPYNNEDMQYAQLPFDAFTSTPDYTPFTYVPRTVDAPCNASNTDDASEAEQWDFSEPDDQPGLSQQIMRMMTASEDQRGVHLVEPIVSR